MPPKSQQKSILNQTKNLLIHGDDRHGNKFSQSTIGIEENSTEEHDGENKADDYEDLELEEHDIEGVISRTSLLILDYLQFKAARSIQRFIRGWLCRTLYQRKRKAAIIIQAEWRRFYCQRQFYKKLEECVQQHIEKHFFQSAQKIQALWRGWWVRKHIHDHRHLLHMQITAGEDLLYCVAFKLHHLLRTHQIPGVYSLRNSTALSKVEKLLASLTFKTCNERSRRAKTYRQQETEEARKKHKDSKFGTEIPFTGPNINNSCVPKCMPFYNEKNVDSKMAKILQMYEEANRETAKPKILRKKSKTSKQFGTMPKTSGVSFCGDVVNSMKKWKIISENNLNVDSNILKKPVNVENFVEEVESKMTILQENGNCMATRVAAKNSNTSGSLTNLYTAVKLRNSSTADS